MGILSLHESSDLRHVDNLYCIHHEEHDQHCIHCESFADLINPVGSGHLSFLYSHKKAAMLKYFAFLAFLAVSLRRCVALQRLA